ncbi:DUF7059 domain-containing protein [Nigerium massiliense]|uniref:DUF7059 domain-containing protein n=1 Tax=Nigerium massiliense TaxID=1522317 RepID=UPI00058F21F2|nr:methyltransferase [Nigerium massiliense]
MLPDPSIARLRERLLAADYTYEPVTRRLGESGSAGLARNTTFAARDALGGDRDPQATLMRLWVVQDAVSRADAERALGAEVDALLDAGLLAASAGSEGDTVRARVEIRPYAAEATATTAAVDGWVCHDPLTHMDERTGDTPADFVLGVSPASTTLAQLTIRRSAARALDLGTGCGVQTLHLSRHVEDIVATDLNPRALELARVTCGLNQVDADLRLGSLYEPVAGERFDLIVTNPPFVMSPPSDVRLTYREGTEAGDGLVEQVVTGGGARLAADGTMQVLCNWAILGDRPWQDRLADWIRPTGCDAFVVQRERLDPYEYAEIWLTDAGANSRPDYAERYREWVDYFAALGIVGVGMGWISLRRAGRDVPDLRFEEWPHGVHQPIGDAFAAQHRAVDLLQRTDADLLGARWCTLEGVVQETLGRPGADNPEHLVLRQTYGLGRALEADTGLAALVGACDGDLTAAQIIDAIASIYEVDAGALRAELTPRLRELVADGYLDE